MTLSVATTLDDLGWDEAWQTTFEPHAAAGLVPGRITIQHRGAYVLFADEGEVWAELPRRLLRDADGLVPAVGDWVAIRPAPGDARAQIEGVLPRRSAFSRRVASDQHRVVAEQVVAANVDVVLIVQSVPDDFNVRRLERYLATAWESGANPAIVLTKIDLVDDVEPYAVEADQVGFGLPVFTVSSVTGEGFDDLRTQIGPGRTVALLGSSGVGKSTIVNRLAGHELLPTQDVRRDGRGRHTTTHRELVVLPGGGVVLDTPGMRELQLWTVDEGLERTFADVEEIAGECRFRDCAHEREPGCAIRAALESGRLPGERWASYRRLQRELRALHERMDVRARKERTRRYKIQARAMRKRR